MVLRLLITMLATLTLAWTAPGSAACMQVMAHGAPAAASVAGSADHAGHAAAAVNHHGGADQPAGSAHAAPDCKAMCAALPAAPVRPVSVSRTEPVAYRVSVVSSRSHRVDPARPPPRR